MAVCCLFSAAETVGVVEVVVAVVGAEIVEEEFAVAAGVVGLVEVEGRVAAHTEDYSQVAVVVLAVVVAAVSLVLVARNLPTLPLFRGSPSEVKC